MRLSLTVAQVIFVSALMAVAIALSASFVSAQKSDQPFPDVVSAKVTSRGADTFDFDVTISSPYDTAQRYADAFRVLAADGKVLGERVLLHDHADEQPFTRDLYRVKIAGGIKTVTIVGRDKANGWGGKTIDVMLPGR